MKKINKIGYSLRDIAIIQAPISYQSSRKNVNPYVNICDREVLPIFVSPMSAVTDENNYKTWIDNKVTPVVPRTVMQRLSIKERLAIAHETFVSFSLQETYRIFNFINKVNAEIYFRRVKKPIYICIDIAHGTLAGLYDICTDIKTIFGDNVIIMTGNTASDAKVYTLYCKAGIDYMRCSIGTGSRCTSSINVGVHKPMATLLDDLNEQREVIKEYNRIARLNNEKELKITKLIADGGIYWFDDINKALALGADAVMIGRGFAECEEACGEYHWAWNVEAANNNNWLSTEEKNNWIKLLDSGEMEPDPGPYGNPYKLKPYRNYYGMSTRTAQAETSNVCNKTSEGIAKHVEIKYPVKKWLNNVESYLRSAMTYTNSATIEDFNKAECIILGGSTYQTYAK